VARGERLNKSGNSWFSPKTIEVVPPVSLPGVEHCNGCGGHSDLLRHSKLRIPASASRGDRHRVLTSGVERETTQTAD
jgi:hypothetical protein